MTEPGASTIPERAASVTVSPADAMRVMADARAPISSSERRRAYDVARNVTVLALLDALEDPSRDGATAEAACGLLREASADRLTVLLEPIHAHRAHRLIQALAHAGLVAPEVARVAHMRIDMRRDPARGDG
jgi:hypothetical protein